MKISIRVLMAIVLIILVFNFSNSRAQFLFFGSSLEGKPAPEFTLDTLRRDNVSFSEYRGERPAILFFWTTWCFHCRVALRELNQKILLFKDKGISILLIDVGEARNHIASYFEREAIDLDAFLDKDSSVASEYQIVGVPTFIFVNRQGIITAIKHDLDEMYERFLFDE